MDAIVKYILKFLTDFLFGKEPEKKKTTSGYRNVHFAPKAAHQPEPYVPPKKYRDSRWEELDDLFWNMMQKGVILRKRESGCLLSNAEIIYRKNLEDWFGRHCYVSCQVSLGQLIDLPEQGGFSKEEQSRFFSMFSKMAMDFVIVSIKTNKIVCVIELNDSSHKAPKRVERDRKLLALMKKSKIPFMFVDISQIDVEPDIWTERKNTLSACS
ncbi:DUF2726 domain-containing protein [Erwinia sp. OPT-41]|uniref:DUF2726 domain-containing protein n=1 Tax=Erwinia plantamica TaxID=3237104 RepID=A0ABW7CL09_9GAMM